MLQFQHYFFLNAWNAYYGIKGDLSKEVLDEMIIDYINGYKMLAYAPWHTVDDVFIPVNLEGKLHWILIVISFNDRCIKVYDSINNSLHHSFVFNHIKKYAQLIPMYLVKSDLYLKKGFDIASHHRYQGHTVYDSFKIVYVEDLPQQPAASL